MENKTIDLTKILKVGQKVWCDMFGECEVISISYNETFPIKVEDKRKWEVFTRYGTYKKEHPIECCLIWPSKDVRSWNGFRPEIPDKTPIIAWDNEKLYKVITFYDAINERTFSSDGKRNYAQYDNYEIIENPDQWMIDAQKHLID